MSTTTMFPVKPRSQRGYVMVLSIIMLLVITLLTVSMAKSFFFEEGMAGNVREKNRSHAAAQAALNYAENFVMQGNAGVSSTCSGLLASAMICSGVNGYSAGSNKSPLAAYFVLPASAMPTIYLNSTNNIAQDTFYQPPGAYIQYVGISPGTNPEYLYTITAYGYGSSPNSVSILQSYYGVVSLTPCTNSNSGC